MWVCTFIHMHREYWLVAMILNGITLGKLSRKKKKSDLADLQNHRGMENYLEASPAREIATFKNLGVKQTVTTEATMTKHPIAKKFNFSVMPAKGPHLHKRLSSLHSRLAGPKKQASSKFRLTGLYLHLHQKTSCNAEV